MNFSFEIFFSVENGKLLLEWDFVKNFIAILSEVQEIFDSIAKKIITFKV